MNIASPLPRNSMTDEGELEATAESARQESS